MRGGVVGEEQHPRRGEWKALLLVTRGRIPFSAFLLKKKNTDNERYAVDHYVWKQGIRVT
jgi:hypothetical protein